jgi:hypothetical protein
MTVSVDYEIKKSTEQNKNTKELKIPTFVIESVNNLITEDKFNLFKLKSKESIEDKLKEVEIEITKLLRMKNEGLLKEQELEKKLLVLRKSNSQLEMELKKSLKI